MLENQLGNIKLGSSLVFYGSDQEITLSAARGLAQFVDVSKFDITEIEPEILGKNSKGEISIKLIKELIRTISLTPGHGKGRMAIIKSADKLSHDAANALLKTLEEPSATSLIVLLSSDLKQLSTILSRCRIIRFADKKEQPKDNEASGFGWPKENLKQQFKKIEELSQLESLETYMESLLASLYGELQQNPESVVVKKITSVFDAKRQLKLTTNKRLVLENLLLEFKNPLLIKSQKEKN